MLRAEAGRYRTVQSITPSIARHSSLMRSNHLAACAALTHEHMNVKTSPLIPMHCTTLTLSRVSPSLLLAQAFFEKQQRFK
jgi:hypothetical protein